MGTHFEKPPNCPNHLNFVSDLIDHEALRWKTSLINSLFPFKIATAINAIPIASLGSKDTIIWCKDRSGTYTVKASYCFLLKQHRLPHLHNLGSSLILPPSAWGALWHFKAQPKIKVFLWKAILNALPVKVNLANRVLPVDFWCLICQSSPETIEHMLFWCAHSRAS